MPKARSKAQMRFFGGVASGSIKAPGFSKAEARKALHSSKGTYKSLPSKRKGK